MLETNITPQILVELTIQNYQTATFFRMGVFHSIPVRRNNV